MKKSEFFHLREGIARDLLRIFSKFEEFVDVWDKKQDRLYMEVERLKRKHEKKHIEKTK